MCCYKSETESLGSLPPGLHVLHIGHWRVVLHRHETETDSVKELDAVHAGDAHVQEDTKENGKGDKLEDWCQEDRDAKEHRNCKSSHPLVSNPDHLGCLSRNMGCRHDGECRHMADSANSG